MMAARIASAASQLESFGDNVSGAKSETCAELGKQVCRVPTSMYLLLKYAFCQQAWAKAKSQGPRKERRLLCCSALSSASHYTGLSFFGKPKEFYNPVWNEALLHYHVTAKRTYHHHHRSTLVSAFNESILLAEAARDLMYL